MSLGDVLAPNAAGIEKTTLAFSKPEGDIIGSIQDRKLFVHFHGVIAYKDVFEKAHQTKFRYIWTVTDLKRLTDDKIFAYWQRCGLPEDNSET